MPRVTEAPSNNAAEKNKFSYFKLTFLNCVFALRYVYWPQQEVLTWKHKD